MRWPKASGFLLLCGALSACGSIERAHPAATGNAPKPPDVVWIDAAKSSNLAVEGLPWFPISK